LRLKIEAVLFKKIDEIYIQPPVTFSSHSLGLPYMATSTYIDTRSAYGTRYTTSATEVTESEKTRGNHYELFLLIQDLLRNDGGIILEFPIDELGQKQPVGISLGAGGFSSVQRRIAKGHWGNRSVMAYKRINPHFDQDGRFDDHHMLAQIVDELKLLAIPGLRSHPNINQLKGISFETQGRHSDGYLFPALMFDATSLGTLLDFIQDPVRMVDGPYWEYCLDVAQGLQALHSQGFIHGDVKCENVLMFPTNKLQGRNCIAKLTDFGCSMMVDVVGPRQYTRLRGVTIPYDAPEADAEIQSGHLPFTDTYSFGLLVWRLIIDGADPFNDPRYRSSTTDDGARYNYTLIREDKRNGTTLSLALNRVFDPDRALSPETRDGFGEMLRIALSCEAIKRDLGRIIQILSCPQK
jgi:serine/threonine protein kinase